MQAFSSQSADIAGGVEIARIKSAQVMIRFIGAD
jgi:hypothetical protein